MAGIDDSALCEAEDELERLVLSLAPQAIHDALHLFDVIAKEPHQLIVIEGHRETADGAEESSLVRLKPSALFRELMTAIRIRTDQLEGHV